MNETTETTTAEPAIYRILRKVIEKKASDLHLSAMERPIIRVNGEMTRMEDEEILDGAAILALVSELMHKEQSDQFQQTNDLDFSFEVPNLSRFRVNLLNQNRGCSAVLRAIPSKILTLKDILAPAIFAEISSLSRGLVLVTGATGSGKSTTLAAMIDHINKTRQEHILTLEDPIEFVHQNQKCLITQREIHRDTESFESALKAALREDPDIILVGEMRDLETIKLALTAAETGHLVFGTLHTTSAAKTVNRIIDVFPSAEKEMIRVMISESLQAVICQNLVKKKDGSGRLAVHEIMIGTPAIRNLIRENKVPQLESAIETGKNLGMKLMDTSLQELYANRLISKEDALAIAKDPNKIKD